MRIDLAKLLEEQAAASRRIDLSGMPGPRTRGEGSRIDLGNVQDINQSGRVNREGKRDRADKVEVSGLGKGIAREALGQGALMGFGDDIEALLTSRNPADVERERAAFAEERPATATASHVGGVMATGGVPFLMRAAMNAMRGGGGKVDELPPRFEPDLRQAMRNVDKQESAAAPTDAKFDQLQRLLSSPEARADVRGQPMELSPSDIFMMAGGQSIPESPPGGEQSIPGAAPGPQNNISPEEEAMAAMSPTDAIRFAMENQRPADDATRAKNLKTTGLDALSVIPGPAQVLSAQDAITSGGSAVSNFGQGNLKAGAVDSLLAALGVFGAVTGSPFSRSAGKAAEGAPSRLNTFVGPEAKTADKEALAMAEQLKAAGANRDEIWKSTGWAWDERGLPYFEIDDSAAKLNSGSGFQPQYFDDFMDHPALFEAKPDIASRKFSETSRPNSGYHLAPDAMNPNGRIDVGAGSRGTRLSIGLHEGQHAADFDRGASHGANASIATPEALEEASEAMRGKFGEAFTNWEAANQAYKGMFKDSAFALRGPEMDAAVRRLAMADSELAKAQRSPQPITPPRYAYDKNPGEARARNTEARRTFSALERRETPPWETLDVDEADVLSGRAASSAPSQVLVPTPKGDPLTERALEMRGNGEDPAQVWRETYRAISPSGAARKEIPDQPMKFREGLKPGDNMTVGEAVDHPRLFEAFPSLRDRPLKINADVDETGNPVRRTTPEGGFQVNPEGNGDMRGVMAKLFQYEINKASGGAAPLRHGMSALERALDDATRRADLLDPQNPKSRAAIDRYLDEMRGVKDDFNVIRDASLTKGWQGGGFSGVSSGAKRLTERSAGNVEGRIAQRRATFTDDAMSAWPYRRKTPEGVRGQDLPRFEGQYALPPEGMKGRDLRAFIEAWEEFGAGRK